MRRGRVRNLKNHNIKSRRKTVVKPKVAPKPVKITAVPAASVLPTIAIKRSIAPKVTKKVIAKQKAAKKAVAKKNQT